MYDIKVLSANVRNARLLRNYSQDYLAYKLKISQNAYSKIECGYTRLTLERLTAIGEILQVSLSRLIGITDIEADIKAVSRIAIVPKLLEVVCRITGMGFAAIARVTEDKWIACSVHDEIQFGLAPGGELKLETTICNEIRQHGEAVVIDHVAKDKTFAHHPTPVMYGFQSYISMPIIRQDGSFFGTLCAIDPKPAKLNNLKTIGMFKLFAELISFHLDLTEKMAFTEAGFQDKLPQSELADSRMNNSL
jgi:transcriptional regulator with XRE-family HTH domain